MATDMSSPSHEFLTGTNGDFLEALYLTYLENPAAVDASWAAYFSNLAETAETVVREHKGASWTPKEARTPGFTSDKAPSPKPSNGLSVDTQVLWGSIRALRLIRAYRARGHLAARLDPLGIEGGRTHPELDPAYYGFTADDLDKTYALGGTLGLEQATLREILHIVERTYASHIGVEFTHIQDPDANLWLEQKCEARHLDLSQKEKKDVLTSLTKAEGFERFLAIKYPGAKRFGLEGGESLIPAMEFMLERAGDLGVEEVVLGMAHRGRLNVLTHILGKPPRAIFSEFQGTTALPDDFQGSGDVKYHLGASGERAFGAHKIRVSLTSNPSHLEAVNPVVVGKVRAKQTRREDAARTKLLGLLIHGDAAFAGQGLVAETLLLSDLAGYRTGGTIHIIINNQIGFTTSPNQSRSSPYSSDVAKMIQAPVIHVNADDPDAVMWVARLAAEYRQTFHKDIVIDLFCYRRHGHNEMDEPAFTQPLMYAAISKQPTTRALYAAQLTREGLTSEDEAKSLLETYHADLQKEFDQAPSFKAQKADWLEGAWSGIQQTLTPPKEVDTSVPLDTLQRIGQGLVRTPDGFALNDKLVRLMKNKEQMFKSGEGFDWATGEALAFGSLLCEGYPVRLSGQDCGRGTFSHRHAVLVDQKNAAAFVPLNSLKESQAEIEIVDSPLAEASVLGFELGYSLADPHCLVLWEAQFGDFANGAQVIFDQFIAAGEAKWMRLSGLVMLLPHGYEGQGPEHSSARLERYLQACAENNIIVANCSTPASYFHILRRQIIRNQRKPLVIMTPKSLLRDKRAASSLKDFAPGTTFEPILLDPRTAKIKASEVKRIVICSGKIYYDIMDAVEAEKLTNILVIRQEQLYPYPHDLLVKALSPYPNADVVWCQEEPQNMGAWTFIDRRLEAVLVAAKYKAPRPRYVGRAEAASTATGYLSRHIAQEKQFIGELLRFA
ncbi:MAG: 2-oxoglutarate dehydrogenase E1 component [Alphaproteobacteria bacterium]|nr:2-oxoglutarate dehydrogenase E1 component [Alphaproteobacteria bacterium]